MTNTIKIHDRDFPKLDLAVSTLTELGLTPEWLENARDERAYTFRALTAARRGALRLNQDQLQRDRFVILSDIHRADRYPGADDFVHNENVYTEALGYYLENDYRLILNGDVEEGWKAPYPNIIAAYEDSAYALERKFAAKGEDYYIRTYGNHDVDWANPSIVDKYLTPFFGRKIRVFPAVLIGQRLMIAHGHQGDLASDRLTWLSRRVVRYLWKPLQRMFGFKLARAAENSQIRSKRDRYLYEWASAFRTLLIAGHTHRPLLGPFALEEHDVPREQQSTVNYANSGACVHREGITGLELDRGEIRLIKWSQNGSITRSIFRRDQLEGLLARL